MQQQNRMKDIEIRLIYILGTILKNNDKISPLAKDSP